MKTRISLIVLGSLVLAACGPSKALEAGRGPASVTDDGISYPRTFSASVELRDSLSSQGRGGISFSPQEASMVFGCSETSGGDEFVFYMKAGEDQFKMTMKDAKFRESLSTYPNLVEVELAGRLLGNAFDRATQSYQLNECQGTNIQRRGNTLSGDFQCFNVTGIDSKEQSTLTLHFRCDVVGR